MIIRDLATRIFVFISILSIAIGCQVDNPSSIEFKLLDVFASLPKADEKGERIGLGEFLITLELSNSGQKNYYLELERPLERDSNFIDCFIKIPCADQNEMQLNLGYVTHGIVLMPVGKIDTIVLRADFRDLSNYYPECFNEKTIEAINHNHIYLNYEAKKDTQIQVNDVRYQLLNSYVGHLTL